MGRCGAGALAPRRRHRPEASLAFGFPGTRGAERGRHPVLSQQKLEQCCLGRPWGGEGAS